MRMRVWITIQYIKILVVCVSVCVCVTDVGVPLRIFGSCAKSSRAVNLSQNRHRLHN